MAFILFEVEAWLAASFQSNVSVPIWRLIVESMMMLAAVVPAFLMARVEGHPFSDFGLPLRSAFHQGFWVGSLWGLGALTAMMLLLRASGAFQFGHLALHGVRVSKFAIYYAALFLATAFFEEFLLRGYSQWILSRAIKFWPAAICLSILFGYMHQGNPGEARTGLFAAGLIGFFLCFSLRRTGNLWWAVGFHMAWDWGESFLYSVPDSGALLPGHLLNSTMHGPDWLTGGSVGPEGSYLVFLVIAALWILFNRTYPEVKYLPTKPNRPRV
jgi:membrane protease YdiL (CAAX protease family)